eukprot:1157006-Pelagomonas_calceolata.AAC.4
MGLPHQKMRGELMFIRWVSGSTMLQGTSVKGMGSVDSPPHTQEDWLDSNLCTLEFFAQFAVLLL